MHSLCSDHTCRKLRRQGGQYVLQGVPIREPAHSRRRIAIHFPGLKGLDKPVVWVFPKLLVCLNCGFTEFVVPKPGSGWWRAMRLEHNVLCGRLASSVESVGDCGILTLPPNPFLSIPLLTKSSPPRTPATARKSSFPASAFRTYPRAPCSRLPVPHLCRCSELGRLLLVGSDLADAVSTVATCHGWAEVAGGLRRYLAQL